MGHIYQLLVTFVNFQDLEVSCRIRASSGRKVKKVATFSHFYAQNSPESDVD